MIEILNLFKEVTSILSKIKWPVILLLTILFLIKYADNVQVWIGMIERLCGKISSKYRRKAISNEIEGKINFYARSLNTQFEEVMPYGIKIEWIEDDKGFDRQSFLSEDQVIVKMRPHTNQDHNLVVTTLEYVSKGLIPKARNYVSQDLMKAVDYKMVHKILLALRANSALQLFFHEFLPLETKDKEEIEYYLNCLHEIDDHGLFVQILLEELVILGKKLPPTIMSYRERAIAEVKEFLRFLYNLAQLAPGEKSALCFVRKEIKMGIMIAAKSEKTPLGPGAYVRRFQKNLEEGCERVYVMSSGRNIAFAKEIVSEIESNYDFKRTFQQTSLIVNRQGESTRGYTCLFESTPTI